jgi:hypothetical protein
MLKLLATTSENFNLSVINIFRYHFIDRKV